MFTKNKVDKFQSLLQSCIQQHTNKSFCWQ